MKNLLYIAMFMVPTVFFAQEKPKNVSEETTTKTIKVDDGKEVVEKKVKITTREEQQLKLDKADKNKVNQDVVSSPSKVTQTVEVDDDSDSYYDSKIKTIHYSYNDKPYVFKRNSNGFLVSQVVSNSETEFGKAINTSRSNNYVFKSNNYNGIGYFDSNNNFIIEYYDTSKNAIVKKVFTLKK
ncbi:hypothetical protein OS188_10735 [Xanthomarina sp. F1114]|uniref:hypothetical protein n=1 Tax=Xanthomarina sp. F1114 TaxID=2996019 RepID=UPI00225E600E|nr:hypothetical protein [Xanthomarina sp. F1114]MCX7548426.1 hypothetical protein [Xanthomarina sp. F1114]